MRANNSSRGAIALVLVVVVVLVGALGFVGWRMLMRKTDTESAKMSGTSAKVILTKDDLDAATKSLDEIDFNDSSSEAAEKQASL